ncbi:MAG: methyltransferase domain-containing protein [Lachnospiraceae bacterium]|nr:methyltransferase domain-containing protein [Lachnospiraceae bacterium]
MNTIWSDYFQNIGTLYLSRTLRFSDVYKEKYQSAFCIDDTNRNLKMLEVGCGPGALTQSLARWYPNADIIGVDRDTSFIDFAAQQAPQIQFVEADATALPFADNTFDVTISNTVQEHIEPAKFFGEQLRVLKPGGICLVLSMRRGVSIDADCITEENSFEQEIWDRVNRYSQEALQKYAVGQYAMNESELPLAMEKYGFRQISTEYLTINLTPDNPGTSKEQAYAMINAHRQTAIDAVNSIPHTAPGIVSEEELVQMRERVNQKYDKRIELYDKGSKQWDTSMSLTMVLRGMK